MLDLPSDWMEQIKAAYPKRAGDHGWMKVRTLVPRAVVMGYPWERIIAGARNYATHCQRKGLVGTEYVKQAATFFGRDAWFDEWAEMDMRTPAEIAEAAEWERLQVRAERLGFTQIDRSRGIAVVRAAIEAKEREQPRQLGQPKFRVV